MRRRLVDVLCCPVCQGQLRLHLITETREPVSVEIEEPRCSTFCTLHDLSLPVSSETGESLDCGSCYGGEIRDGLLECAACGLLFPIIEGVPRLIRNAYEEYEDYFYQHRSAIGNLDKQSDLAHRLGRLEPSVFDRRSNESFSLQWEIYQYQDRTWFKDDIALRRQEFLLSMDIEQPQLRGAFLLDAGCGNGRLTATVARYGAEIVGLDLSRSVERADLNRAEAAGEQAPFVHFVQGNIMEPPLRVEAFDHIHTSGVLHHTPDPPAALRSFLTLGKPGGRVYVQLYRKREAWIAIPNRVLRFFTCRMPVRFLYRLCYWMVPVHTALVLLVARLRGEKSPIRQASRRERAVSMFDHFSPRYQFRYTPEQARKLLENSGLSEVRDVTLPNEARHMVAFVGDR